MGQDDAVTDPDNSTLPEGYFELLAQVKTDVLSSQLWVTRTANTQMLNLYWRIGRLILDRQTQQGWGARIIDRLSADLRRELPGSRGWSVSNLASMRAMAAAWPTPAILQQAVGELPWGQVVTLLTKLDLQDERDWYARRAALNLWSRKTLEHHIATRLRDRTGAAPSNFAARLESGESDQAQELLRDPYVFDFLGLTEQATERELEDGLMSNLQDTLLALGNGLVFVGRQYRVPVGTEEIFIDLLLFDVENPRYVVFELKVGHFKHEYARQLGFYVTVVDEKLRRPDRHSPTVGILLCASHDDWVVRYALQSQTAPIAVSTYTYDTLPAAERAALPAAAAITAAARLPPAVTDPAALLAALSDVHPHLSHQRSIDRIRNVWLDIAQGKDDPTLLRNITFRFSNGNTVDLSDRDAAQILEIARMTLAVQPPSTSIEEPTTAPG